MKRNMLFVLMILVLGSTFMVASSHKAVIFGAYVKYKSSTDIYVTAGSGRCNDNFWENAAETTVDLYSVLPAGEDFVYIYIDDSASSYPTPTFIGSTTEPAWSNTKIGWYNGNDRCIGVVYVDTYGNIRSFQNNSRSELLPNDLALNVLSNGNPNGSFQTAEATAKIPVNANGVFVWAANTDMNGTVNVQVSSYESSRALLIAQGDNNSTIAIGWISLERGGTRDLKWKGQDDDDNGFNIWIYGYRIER